MAIWILLGLVVAATVLRSLLGVDFTDEALYSALPYRLVLGDRPFVDEIYVQQSAGLLVVPFMAAFTAVTGGTTALIPFCRCLFVGLILALAAAGGRWLAKRHGANMAAMVASVFIIAACVPYVAPSYNTLGSAFLVAGLACSYAAESARWRRLAAGLFLGLGAIAYPPFVAVWPAVVVCRLKRDGLRAWRESAEILAAAILVTLPVAALLLYQGPHAVLASVLAEQTVAAKGGGALKLATIGHHLAERLSFWGFLACAATALVSARSGRARPLAIIGPVVALTLSLALGPLAAMPWTTEGHVAVLLPFVLLGPCAALPYLRTKPCADLLWLVWLPSLLAAGVQAFTSDTGLMATHDGFLPALLASLVLLYLSFKNLPSRPWTFYVLAGSLLTYLIALDFGRIYRDGPLMTLTERVSDGPFAGLFTTPWKRTLLDDLQHDLDAVVGDAKVIFYNDFPAGYLMTKAQPASCAAWMYTRPWGGPSGYRKPLAACIPRLADRPVVAVKVRFNPRLPAPSPAPLVPGDAVEALLTRCQTAVLRDRPAYKITMLDRQCLAAGS